MRERTRGTADTGVEEFHKTVAGQQRIKRIDEEI